ncbi:MAG: imidazole glycerol phosphate synthase subunit HisH [Ignavibacteriales bacterium]|nr:imidazole glycerol phosphate synthase subunit HisH [Ignavibacteriales bacterium]
MIVIIDYGMGNLRSVQKAFERIKIPVLITSDKTEILKADKIVLPGVGNFERGISNLKSNGLFDTLNERVTEHKIPILGICLGMQLMTEFSEEGNVEGFGWIKARTIKFVFDRAYLKIPHMGWNNINVVRDSPITNNISSDNLFYFVHSYYVSCENRGDVLATSNYGVSFVSSFQKENIYGCQFHPEKSHDAGLQMLKNFSEL